jgi:hypothetical protein
MEQVRAWIADADLAIEEETEGPWHNGNYAYHHVLALVEVAPQGT